MDTCVKTAAIAFIGALSLSFGAYAQSPAAGDSGSPGASADVSARTPESGASRDLKEEFRALDKNGNGYLSKDELASSALPASGFDTADKDQNGKLDIAEFQSLEASASPDRSLGSVAPTDAGSSAAGGSSTK